MTQGAGPELELLTVAEAATKVRVCQRLIRDAYRQGHLRVVRIGSRTLIKPAHLDEWVSSCERGGAGVPA